jgi:hypothetical protein
MINNHESTEFYVLITKNSNAFAITNRVQVICFRKKNVNFLSLLFFEQIKI